MTRKEKLGVSIIVGVLCILGVVYAITADRPANSSGDFTNNPITERRVNTQRLNR